MTVTPFIVDVVAAQIEGALANLHTCMPAEVIRVHAGQHKRQFVDVQPSLQRRAYNEDNAAIAETLPIVPMVPVGYAQGGGFFMSVPLAVGDFVLLVFAERSLDQWLETARKGALNPTPPGDVGTHTLEGAIAMPCGPAPRAALLEGVDAADLVVGGPTGILARFTRDGMVRLAEGDGEDAVALAGRSGGEFGRIQDDLTQLVTAIKAGLGACQPKPGVPLEPAPAFEAAAVGVPSNPASVAATKVRAR